MTAAVVRSSAPWVPVYDRALWRETLRQVLPVAAATTFGTIYFRLVLIVMSLVGTEAQTGHFSVSFRIMEIALAVPAIIVASAFPILVRAAAHDRARLDYALTRIAEVGVILGLWFALMIWLLAPLAVDLVSGGRSDETIGALRLQGLSMPASFLVAAGGSALLSLRDNRGLLISNAAAFVVALAAALALIGPLGAEGGGLAIAIAEVGLAASLALFVRRGAQLRVPRRLAIAVPVAAGAWALGTVLPRSPARRRRRSSTSACCSRCASSRARSSKRWQEGLDPVQPDRAFAHQDARGLPGAGRDRLAPAVAGDRGVAIAQPAQECGSVAVERREPQRVGGHEREPAGERARGTLRQASISSLRAVMRRMPALSRVGDSW